MTLRHPVPRTPESPVEAQLPLQASCDNCCFKPGLGFSVITLITCNLWEQVPELILSKIYL